jgi:hypothetical protein
MEIKIFLEEYFEKYNLGDLESISAISRRKKYGAAGYPMLMTIFSSMELLGYLSMSSKTKFEPWKKGKTKKWFCNYWRNYFFNDQDQKFGFKKETGKIIYELCRNGIAHNFITKGDITVNRGGSPSCILGDKIILYTDDFYRKFEKSYYETAKPYLLGIGEEIANWHLQEIKNNYVGAVKKPTPNIEKMFREINPSISVSISNASTSPFNKHHI